MTELTIYASTVHTYLTSCNCGGRDAAGSYRECLNAFGPLTQFWRGELTRHPTQPSSAQPTSVLHEEGHNNVIAPAFSPGFLFF
jgi:hypothetical protein